MLICVTGCPDYGFEDDGELAGAVLDAGALLGTALEAGALVGTVLEAGVLVVGIVLADIRLLVKLLYSL